MTRATLGRAAQGPNRHDSCTHQPTSRRQGHERNLPSLAAEPQLLPGPPGSLVLSANLQVLRGCLPTCSRRSLRGFSGQPSGLATRPPDNLVGIKHPVLRSFTRGTIPGKRTPGGLDKNTRDTFRDIHRTRNHSYALSAWIPHVGPSLQFGFSGRCDAQGRDSSPHAGDRKRTPPSPSKPPISDVVRGPKGKGRLVRVCGLRRLTSSAIEIVRRVPRRGSGVATKRARRVTLPSFLA